MLNLKGLSDNLNEDTLKSLEQYWEFGLPNEYRSFLLKYNGGYPDRAHFYFKGTKKGSIIHAFLGVTSKENLNILIEIKSYLNRIPKSTFPIAYDVCGNLILISVKNPDRGKVYFWDHELEADPAKGETPDYSNLTLIANSFNEFLDGLETIDALDV